MKLKEKLLRRFACAAALLMLALPLSALPFGKKSEGKKADSKPAKVAKSKKNGAQCSCR